MEKFDKNIAVHLGYQLPLFTKNCIRNYLEKRKGLNMQNLSRT